MIRRSVAFGEVSLDSNMDAVKDIARESPSSVLKIFENDMENNEPYSTKILQSDQFRDVIGKGEYADGYTRVLLKSLGKGWTDTLYNKNRATNREICGV